MTWPLGFNCRLRLFGHIDNGKMLLNNAGKMVENEWLKLSQRFTGIEMHEYVVMPNHFHGIMARTHRTGEHKTTGEHKVRPYGTLDGTIGRVIQAYKSISTNEYIDGVKNTGWQRFDGKLWQRNYWEHIIRNENEYQRIAQYIIDNPQKWDMDTLNGGEGNKVMESFIQYNGEAWMV